MFGLFRRKTVFDKLTEATAHKDAGSVTKAVEALEDARNAVDPADQNMVTAVSIRTAKYLQRDGRGVEGWAMLAKLLDASSSVWHDIDVLDAMRLHLQREGEAGRAVHYGIAHRLARVQLYCGMAMSAKSMLENDTKPPRDQFERGLWEGRRTLSEHSLRSARQWLSELETVDAVAELVGKLLKKAKQTEHAPAVLLTALTAIQTDMKPRDYLRQHDVKAARQAGSDQKWGQGDQSCR